MDMNEIWNCDRDLSDVLDIDVPSWIDADISPATIASIVQGGCASGAYMPAVTYWRALATMNEYGDAVMQYIGYTLGELPAPDTGESWAGVACRYLSLAVELWAGDMLAQLVDFEPETTEA
jgi:hypothetical protein